MPLIGQMVLLLMFGFIDYLIFWPASYLNIQEPVRKAIVVDVVIIGILYLVGYVLSGTGVHMPSLR